MWYDVFTVWLFGVLSRVFRLACEVRLMNEHGIGTMAYRPLPEGLRPHYTTQADLRLLRRAYRCGWTDSVPQERQQEWFADVAKVCGEARSQRMAAAAIKVFLSIMERDVAVLQAKNAALPRPGRGGRATSDPRT
jgi:hypothetical protein